MKKQIKIMFLLFLALALLVSGCTETNNNANNEEDTETPTNEDTNNDETDESSETEEEYTGLLAHWKFDETSGTVASDSEGNFDGTIYGNATWGTGKKGNALYFDGIDDYVKLSQDAIDSIGNLSIGTISFWINYTSILDSQVIMPIFYIGNEDKNDDDSLFVIEIGHFGTDTSETDVPNPSDKKLYATWVDINQEQNPFLCFDTNENLEENTWIHFTVVVKSSGNTVYMNGEELTDRHYNFGTKSDQKFLSDIPVQDILTFGYGKSHSDVSSDFLYYKGYIDDLRIYEIALDIEEIQNII